MRNWKSIEIPDKIKDLPKDKNGYPIPFTLTRDQKGIPDFSQHDNLLLHECFIKKRCAICGQHLASDFWLLAGAKISLEPKGGYIDPPIHKECGTYALQICPYLALPSFLKRSHNSIGNSGQGVRVLPGKPTVWGFVKIAGYRLFTHDNGTIIIIPERPFIEIEYWREGNCIPWSKAKQFI